MRLIAIICTFGYTLAYTGAFSQSGTLSLQAAAGNNTFVNPYTGHTPLSPSLDLLVVKRNSDTTAGTGWYWVAGISYTRSTQIFSVISANTSTPRAVSFYTNEYLFNSGACVRLFNQEKLSIGFSFLFQAGQNYTKTDDATGQTTMSRVVSTSSSFSGFLQPAGAHYSTRTRTVAYRWAQVQLYVVPGMNLYFRTSRRATLYLGFHSRIFLLREPLGEDPGVFFNYAPVKINAQAGILLNLFKRSK